MRVIDIESIRIKLASPEDILNWSQGEVTKAETINYRTQRPEKDGLFCEKIFGPTKDFECYCGKYKRIRYKGMICDRCGVLVTKAQVRRERMGHIKLAVPCSHIWFLRGVPSRIGMVLDISIQQLEKVVYFSSYIVTSVNEETKKKILTEIEKEYKQEVKNQKQELKIKLPELKLARDKAHEELIAIKPLKILSETDYFYFSKKYEGVFKAGTGAETLREIFKKIDLKKEINNLKNKKKEEETSIIKKKVLTRLNFFQGMLNAKIRPEWMFLTILPVLPPDLRPMVHLDGGRFASSDLNDLYRRIINRNNRLKYLLEIDAPGVIIRNEKRMLQEAVDALIDQKMRKSGKIMIAATTGGKRMLKSLADIIKGKQGRFRQNLLGKRVDYSGRSVIVVGPNLKFNQVGIPKKMALELFKPFIIKKIIDKELAYNIRGASRLVEEKTDDVWESLEEVIKDKLVLLNRAPTLHRLGIQAFYPILIEGEAIQLHPMTCRAFNADFDGDQMAVHLPLSTLAQKEAKEIMLSSLNLLKPATGASVISLDQDISLGCYFLTKIKEGGKGEGTIFSNAEEALMAYGIGKIGLKAKIKCRFIEKNLGLIETSVGRIIFNQAFPKDYPFQNIEVKRLELEKIARDVIQRYTVDEDKFLSSRFEKSEEILDKIKTLGFRYSTWSGISWGMDDLIIPKEKLKILNQAEEEVKKVEENFNKGFFTKKEKNEKIIEIWTRVKKLIDELVTKTLSQSGSVFQIIDSGARGTWSQTSQMAGMKGLVVNPVGQIIELPIKNSFKQGFDILEYFISTHGARKGLADTALRTSSAGYLTRRLVDVAHGVLITEEDCGTEKFINLLKKDADEIDQNFIFKILGRISSKDIQTICQKGEMINWEKAKKIIDNNVEGVMVYSPLTCESKQGICQKCYGWDLGKNLLVKIGEAVGVVAAQAIGEPGTQLTMRTTHTGGVAGAEDIAMGLPRVQEILEVRVPRGIAEISQVDGKILEITPEKIIKIKSDNKEKGGRLKNSKKNNIIEYKLLPETVILVSPGQEIKRGQQLSEGSIDLKEFFKLVGAKETQNYIIKEIQKIYISQGALVHDKHIEIICRQMFSRVKIKNPGDSCFTQGEIVERVKFLDEVRKLKKEKKEQLPQATSLLLGITQVALTTDSFLSAASFQETSRVLIKAALDARKDKLKGLKENVIIGKIIPAGTGYNYGQKKEK
jgi:DNA-directed RNA polymerase subunit beta'